MSQHEMILIILESVGQDFEPLYQSMVSHLTGGGVGGFGCNCNASPDCDKTMNI